MEVVLMSRSKRFLSMLMVIAMLTTTVSIGLTVFAVSPAPQAMTAFNPETFRRPTPNITLDVTDVTRVGASGDTSFGSGNTIKRATPSGVPFTTATYASQAYDGETPVWPSIAFTSSSSVTITSITITGGSASPTLVSGSLANTTAASWEIRGGTANAGSVLKISITYTFSWTNPYTGVVVTDTYTTNGFSYVENIIFPAGVWAFASCYGNVSNAADVQYVSRLLGKGVYGNTIGRASNSSNQYSSGYFDFNTNARVHDGDTTIPRKTMLLANPDKLGSGDQFIANGTGSYSSGDSDRAKTTVYLDTSVQTLQSNNFRVHFFIHGTARSTDSARDLTYETIHVRSGDVSYSGGTGNVLGASSTFALQALNPSGPVDGTTSTGGGFINEGMQTRSTLYGTGAAGSYTLVTQWTGRGDNSSTLAPNFMQYYHAATIEIVNVNKADLRSMMNATIGVTTKTVSGSNAVTTIATANGTDPVNGGISNTNKGKNPQSWYYASGWNLFNNYYEDAWKTLQQPNASQTQINTALNQLTGGRTSLVLGAANYSDRTSQSIRTGLGNTFYGSTVYPLNTVVAAVQSGDTNFNEKLRDWVPGKYTYYTDATRIALEEAYNTAVAAQTANYNVIYQLYIDYCAKQLQDAIDNLAYKANTVTFNANSGTGTMPTQTISAGSSENLIPNEFTKVGYSFAGWSTIPTGAVAYTEGASYPMGSNNVTLYAKWTANTYTIVYNGNGSTGGTTVNSVHTYDTPRALNINGFARPGFTFVGWGLSPTDTVPTYMNQESILNLSSQQGATFTLYAIWTAGTYGIIFNGNGGSGTMSNQIFDYLQTAPLKPNAFTFPGYTFMGWATSLENANAGIVAYGDAADYTLSTVESVILYATWDPIGFAVEFDKNADSATGSMPMQEYLFGQTKPLNANAFVNTGYTFAGWANTPEGPKAYNNGANFTMNLQGITLYARWQANVYSVAYSANGGTGAPAPNSATYDVEFAIPATQPVRAGYLFLGWSTAADASMPQYLAGQTASNVTTADGVTVTLYAVWAANTDTPFRVEYYRENIAGGYTLFETATQYGTSGQLGTAIEKAYTGFTLNATHPSAAPVGTVLGNGSLILRMYYDRNISTLTFVTGGGTAIAPIIGRFGAAVTAPVNPTRSGYVFNGWSPIVPSTIPAADITITAQWTANQYNIVFNGNGATSGIMPNQSMTFGTTALLTGNVFVRNGYVFLGWSTTPGGETVYNDGAEFSMDVQGVTLYAVWSVSTQTPYKVDHYLQSISGATYSLGVTTTLTGTTGEIGLAQWEDLPGFTPNTGHTGNVVAGTILGNGSLTLRLYYTRNSYTITFTGVDGIAPITAKFDQSLTAPTQPTRVGYTFSGWSKNQELTQIVSWPYSMEAQNYTFYPRWTPNNYAVSFDPAGGMIDGTPGTKTSTVSYGNVYSAGTLGFPTPILTGYTFNGWFTAGGTRIFADTVVQITASQSLTAQWSINTYTVSFSLNGGTGTPPQTVNNVFGTPVTLPTSGYANARPGYVFLGWNTSPIATTALSSFSIPEGNETLYAVWQPRQYTVSFNLNGGSGTLPAPITAPVGTSVDISQTGFTKQGYSFIGWGTSPSSTPAEKLETYAVQTQNTILYAIWAGNAHTITLLANGGTGPAVVQIQTSVGSTVDLSAYNNYSKPGFDIVGWSTSQTATEGFWSYQVPTSSATLLFAVYAPNTFSSVTFHSNGGSGTVPSVQVGPVGNAVVLPPQGDLRMPFFNFLGWATSPTATVPLANYAFGMTDTTLYAVWSRVPVSLTASPGTTTIIDNDRGFIYGLEEGITGTRFLNKFVSVNGDAELRITFVADSFGTGTKLELFDRVTSQLVKTYYIIIFGDVDGDGFITGSDENIFSLVTTGQASLAEGSAFAVAADLNTDGRIDNADLTRIRAATGFFGQIDQTDPRNIL